MGDSDSLDSILTLRNDLSDALRHIPDVLDRMFKPPIIDTLSGDKSNDPESDAILSIPGLRVFEVNVEKEIDSLDRVLNNGSPEGAAKVSSNTPYYLSVWKEIASSNHVIGVGQTYIVPATPSEKKQIVKVDVTADEGATWIRVNTIKNSRLRSEFSEIDSYSSSEEDQEDRSGLRRPSPSVNKWKNNSITRMANSLLAAAAANPVTGTTHIPRVHIRLTRLYRNDAEPRIAMILDALDSMGIQVHLGEHPAPVFFPPRPLPVCAPSKSLNLDLSLLVALVSDITHSPSAPDADASLARYTPLVRSWKRSEPPADDNGLASHSRALGIQAEQERARALLPELFERTAGGSIASFYASEEARDRLRGILSKIGGPNERRRAQALFSPEIDANDLFWLGSRYPKAYIKSLVPVNTHPDTETELIPVQEGRSTFFLQLQSTCEALLAGSDLSTTTGVSEKHVAIKGQSTLGGSPALTPHTVRSLLFGARHGMTTLTANKASVRAIIREMKRLKVKGGKSEVALERDVSDGETRLAAIWTFEPRSLAENMRVNDLV